MDSDPVRIVPVDGGYLVATTFEPGGSPSCGPFHTSRETAVAEAQKTRAALWWHKRNARTHGSPVFWSAPFGAVGNLPGWLSDPPAFWRWLSRRLSNAHPHPQPLDLDLELDDADVPAPAAEAGVGHAVGLGDVSAPGAEDGDDGHRDSMAALHEERHELQRRRRLGEPYDARRLRDVRDEIDSLEMAHAGHWPGPPVAPDGTWHPALVGVAFDVEDRFDPRDDWQRIQFARPWADVITRDRRRLRVPLKRPVKRGDYVWAADVLTRGERE